jgi:hypothetical protein
MSLVLHTPGNEGGDGVIGHLEWRMRREEECWKGRGKEGRSRSCVDELVNIT